jgi:hypothetical protein
MACNRLEATMPHSGLTMMIALGEAEHRRVIQLLLTVARAAYCGCDDTEDAGDPGFVKMDRASFQTLSEALDDLDELPDDKPGYVMGPAAKAEWALRGLLTTDGVAASGKGLKR